MSSNRLFGKLALGAALGVALTITATQAWNVTAAPGDTDTTYVPVEPCRLFDTRPGATPTDGLKAPIAAGAAGVRIQQVTGNVGRCVGIPADASAVQLNVTALNPSAQSFLTVYPADQTAVPSASNLNWVAGQAPTPNSVTVTLSPDGKVKFFNAFGTVDVIADVAGYYTPSSLTELENRLGSVESQLTVLGTNQTVVEYISAIDEVVLPRSTVSPAPDLIVADATEQLTVTIDAPSAGKVAVVAHATAKQATNEGRLVCQITDDPNSTTIDAGGEVLGIASPATSPAQPTLGTNRVFDVEAGANTFDLMCAGTGAAGSDVTIHYRSMAATFTAG